MLTRPDKYKYLLSKSPCRFSSPVHWRTHLLQTLFSTCPTPSTSINQDSYVGNASSVIISPTRVTQKSYGNSFAISLNSFTSSKKFSSSELGKKSEGCQIFSTGIRYSSMKPSTLFSRNCITSRRIFFIDITKLNFNRLGY